LVRGLERLVLQRGQARSNGEQSEEAQMSRPFWNQAQKRAPEMGSQDRERPDATTTARQFTAQTANREASNPRARAVTQQGSNQPLQASRETSEVTVEPMRREAEVQRAVTETLRMMEPERAQGTRHINDIRLGSAQPCKLRVLSQHLRWHVRRRLDLTQWTWSSRRRYRTLSSYQPERWRPLMVWSSQRLCSSASVKREPLVSTA
jgi:hypothetical protein